MKLYADSPGRRASQLASDALVLAWVLLCVVLGRVVHDAVLTMLAPAQQVQSAGSSFGRAMRQAQEAVTGVPLVGGELAKPFDQAAGAGASVSDAGRRLGEAVSHLATLLGTLTTLLPAVLVVSLWLVMRLRFARRAGQAQRLLGAGADPVLLDLLALRAITRQPITKLTAISPDPAGAWRSGNRRIVAELASLELRDCGVRAPTLGAVEVPKTQDDPP